MARWWSRSRRRTSPGVGGFWPGSNSAGQSAPSYFRSASCGIPEPVGLAAAGFADMHLVMNVTGLTGALTCDAPDQTTWVEVGPTSGVVPPGGQQQVAVTFDSTGLPSGTHQATLCLATDDPRRPLVVVVVVPLTLVQDPPEITLAAEPRFLRGGFLVDLTWSGAVSDEVDIRDRHRVLLGRPLQPPARDRRYGRRLPATPAGAGATRNSGVRPATPA